MGDADLAARRALRTDLLAADGFPTCPSCGDLCGRLARICVECGARLYEPGAEPLDELHRSRFDSEPVTEAASPAPAPPEGTVS